MLTSMHHVYLHLPSLTYLHPYVMFTFTYFLLHSYLHEPCFLQCIMFTFNYLLLHTYLHVPCLPQLTPACIFNPTYHIITSTCHTYTSTYLYLYTYLQVPCIPPHIIYTPPCVTHSSLHATYFHLPDIPVQ